jgi:hypothetical protein
MLKINKTMNNMRNKLLMTLALLITAATGAWAQEEVLLTTVTPTSVTTYSQSPDGIVTVTLDNITAYSSTYGWIGGGSVTVEAPQGYTITRCVFRQNAKTPVVDDHAPFTATIANNQGDYYVYAETTTGQAKTNGMDGITSIEVYGTYEPPIEVTPVAEPAANTKQWTFTQPGYDVVLTPIYAKTAAFATTGEEPEVTLLAPAPAEGVVAGTDASLIAEGTGIVAFAGTSTEVTQGTVMYAIGTSATTAPALSAFSATVPTAENVGDDGGNVNVWYYIQGADAPANVAATLDNTFENTEPLCLTVSVLSNKFDLTLNPANANTIDATQASKGTVSVKTGDAEAVDKTADITDEGKIEAIKMGSTVTITTKEGYKFRKVEVKKTAKAPAAKDATAEDKGKLIGTDGNIYADVAAATAAGTTAVAKIIYIGTTGHATYNHGLALALTDEADTKIWQGAIDACSAKNTSTPVTGATWLLASQAQWNYMMGANGAGSYTALRDGSNLQTEGYWSSTEYEDNPNKAWEFYFVTGQWGQDFKGSANYPVRACLAF